MLADTAGDAFASAMQGVLERFTTATAELQATGHPTAAQHARDLGDAVRRLDRITEPLPGLTRRLVRDDGPLRHASPEVRAAARDAEVRRIAEQYGAVVADVTAAEDVERELEEQALPSPDAHSGEELAAAREELRLILDAAGPWDLLDAASRLLDEVGHDSAYAALLSSRFGWAYARSRGVPELHEQVRTYLASAAAERGGDAQRQAARALTLWRHFLTEDELIAGVPGYGLASLAKAGLDTARARAEVAGVDLDRPPAEPVGELAEAAAAALTRAGA